MDMNFSRKTLRNVGNAVWSWMSDRPAGLVMMSLEQQQLIVQVTPDPKRICPSCLGSPRFTIKISGVLSEEEIASCLAQGTRNALDRGCDHTAN